MITSEPYSVTGQTWFRTDLTTPVTIDATQDLWTSVEITHAQGEYPLGADAGPAVQGKGDFIYHSSFGWSELYLFGLGSNWNVRAIVAQQWLSVTPVSGTVPADQSIDITVHFDTHGLTPGPAYTTSILIHNNSVDSLVNIPVTLTISGVEYGSLEGTVTDANTGSPIDSALVTATGQDKYEYTTYTNADGEYTIGPMMIGTYDVTCSATGYYDGLEEDVVILVDDTTIVDFALLAPIMVVEPNSIDESISTDDTLTTYITVSNTGSGPLEYNITVYPANKVTKESAKAEFSVSPESLSGNSGNKCAPIESNVSGWYSVANEPGDTNSRLDEWYTYGDINSFAWVTWYVPERVTYFNPADFGLTYPFNITMINHWFHEHSSYPWDDATFHFKIYAEDGMTLLYESEDIEAEHMVEIVHELTTPVSINSAGFYFGVAPVSSSGFPSSCADNQYTGSNHSYYGSPGNWTLFSASPAVGEFIQGVYLTSCWLTVEPLSGIIEPGLVDTVAVTFNSTGIESGTVLTADIVFTSDPDVGTVTIPVQLMVTEVGVGDSPTVLSTKLNSNFPNPFNHSTKISFSLKEKSHVNVSVYNIKGQLVETLVDEEMVPGIYEIPWDVKSGNQKLASGVYFYKLETMNKTFVKKMILMK